MPANIFNMLNVRCSWGRKRQCGVDMATVEDPHQSFGYLPFVLLLGDPLQLRPRGIGLLTDLQAAVADGIEVSVEQEQGVKLFRLFKDVFMLNGVGVHFCSTTIPVFLL